MADIQSKVAAVHNANVDAARRILEQPERYGGLMLEWARKVLDSALATTEAHSGGADGELSRGLVANGTE